MPKFRFRTGKITFLETHTHTSSQSYTRRLIDPWVRIWVQLRLTLNSHTVKSRSTFTQIRGLINSGCFTTLFDDSQILSLVENQASKTRCTGRKLIVCLQCEYLYCIYWLAHAIRWTLVKGIAIQKPCSKNYIKLVLSKIQLSVYGCSLSCRWSVLQYGIPKLWCLGQHLHPKCRSAFFSKSFCSLCNPFELRKKWQMF